MYAQEDTPPVPAPVRAPVENMALRTIPAGVVPFANQIAASHAGLYPSAPRICCFLAPHAAIVLDKPRGKRDVMMSFYVPSIPQYAGESVTVRADGTLDRLPRRGSAGAHRRTANASSKRAERDIGTGHDRCKQVRDTE